MQLSDLFEAIGELTPGQLEVGPDVQLRNQQLILNRIQDLRSAIRNSEDLMRIFQRDSQLQAKLKDLTQKVERRIEILKKVQVRPTPQMQAVFDKLDTECSEFISSVRQAGDFLYRGHKQNVSYFEMASWENKQPKDSRPALSALFDQMMQQLGVKALRSNSEFTTGDESQAKGYVKGEGSAVYIIFPKNGFDFLCTSEKDLILETVEQLISVEEIKHLMDKVDAWASENVVNWRHTELGSTINDAKLLQMNGYWRTALRIYNDNWDWRNNQLGLPEQLHVNMRTLVTPEGVKDLFNPNTTDLVSAIRSGNEVLIHGEFWALKKNDWYLPLMGRYLTD